MIIKILFTIALLLQITEGLQLIIIALISSTLISTLIGIVFKYLTHEKFEKVKGNIAKDAASLEQIGQTIIENSKLIQEKKIIAAEALWKALLEIKQMEEIRITRMVFNLRVGFKGLNNTIKDFNIYQMRKRLDEILNDVEKHRIFFQEETWKVFNNYINDLTMAVFTAHDAAESDEGIPNWPDKEYIQLMLKHNLTEEELKKVLQENNEEYIKRFSGYADIIEGKIIKDIKDTYSGKEFENKILSYSDLREKEEELSEKLKKD